MLRLATPLSVLAVAGASLALAACGSSGGGSASSTTSTTASASTRNADFQKFRQCLQDNGATLPNRRPGGSTTAPPPTGAPGGPGGGGRFNDPKLRKAMQACAKYRPQGAGPGGRGGYGGGNGNRPRFDIKAYTSYLTCLKSAGLDINVADGFRALRNLKASDPKVQAALKSCQTKLPQRPAAPGAGASTSTPGGTT